MLGRGVSLNSGRGPALGDGLSRRVADSVLNGSLGYKLIGVAALLGAGVAGYLTFLDFSGADTAFCAADGGCDIVLSSKYADLFGVPVALIGILGYLTLLAVVASPLRALSKTLTTFSLATVEFSFSLYLVMVQLFVLRSVCPWCMTSFGLMSSIFLIGVLLMIKNRRLSFDRLPSTSILILLALGLVLVLAACGGDEVDEGSYEARLARHLTEEGAVMYGAYWCPHCADQKDSFGGAFKYVVHVECDPRGEDAQPALCQQKGVQAYPTWEINGRFYEGVLPLETLANLSGFSG